jgi:hypothetical protein
MAKKSRERFKDRNKAATDPDAKTKPTATLEALKRRRNRRLLFVGILGLAFPLIEAVAYQFRAITISFTNRSEQVIKRIKVIYDGGEFEIDELKPGGIVNRVIRPDFSFQSKQFGTYLMRIRFNDGRGVNSQFGRIGTIDFSATELYTFESIAPNVEAIPPHSETQLKHNTRPGFPLSLIRDLLTRMGFG